MKTLSTDGFRTVDDIELFGSAKDVPPHWNPSANNSEQSMPDRIRVKKVSVVLYDMGSSADRKKFEKAYPEMVNKALGGLGTITTRTEILSKDGNTSLFKYVELCEFEAQDKDVEKGHDK